MMELLSLVLMVGGLIRLLLDRALLGVVVGLQLLMAGGTLGAAVFFSSHQERFNEGAGILVFIYFICVTTIGVGVATKMRRMKRSMHLKDFEEMKG